MKPKNNFKRNHLINLIIRFISKDNLYICEGCHHIHKRDGRKNGTTGYGKKQRA